MPDAKSIIFPICTGICVLAFLYKSFDLRFKRRDPALIALLVAFACKAISFGLSTPLAAQTVDSWLGIPNIGALGIHLTGGVASSAAILSVLDFWLYPAQQARRRAKTQIAAAVVLALAMIALWLLAATETHERSSHYLLENAHRPVVATYLLLYVTVLGMGMVEIARLGWRFAGAAGRSWLQRGLRLVTAGALLYLVYCINRAAAVVTVQFGLDPLEWELITPLTNGLGILFLAAGLTMPSWGPRLSGTQQSVRNYVAHTRLFPLWRDLYSVSPEIALHPAASRLTDRLAITDISYRLYRRVIEIRDGYLALRPYLGPVPDISPAEPAAQEASRIRTAIHARATSSEPRQAGGNPVLSHDSENFVEELAWLLQVARAYRKLPKSFASTVARTNLHA